MSRIYKATGGESWSAVARMTTGSDTDASSIQRANPGLSAPLSAGDTVQIPMTDIGSFRTSDAELQIIVGDTEIGTLDNFELTVAIDAISKSSFVVPNEQKLRDIFVPISSKLVIINAGGKRIFTGRYKSPIPDNSPDARLLPVICYSLPAVIEIGTPQIKNMPTEWQDAQLENIANDLCGKHGVSVRFEAQDVARFKRVDIQPGQPILGFLAELASQRGLIIASNEMGELVFRDGSAVGTPVSFIEKGPGIDVHIGVNEERYFSSITGTVPARSRKHKKGATFTIENPHRTDMIREYNFPAKDIEPGELEKAVKSAAGRMFAELITGAVDCATWKNDNGDIYWPGQTVWVNAPDEYVYRDYEFLVSMVTLKRTSEKLSSSLNLTMPGVYNGEIPEVLPWQ